MRRCAVPGIIAVLSAAACRGGPPPHTVHGCSPLATDQCLTPFPNAWFEEAAPTATGFEVVFPDGTLPVNSSGTPVRQSAFGPSDGFSPATPIIVYFPQGVDPAGLTPASQAASSLDPQNPIALVDMASGQRIAFFSELDENASPSAGQKQALLIHPMTRLAHAHRYAVAITTALHDASGQPLAPEGAFAQWVANRLPGDAPLAEIASRLDDDAKALASLGISRDQLVLAWDFDTGSENQATGRLVQMRDAVLSAAPQGLGYAIDSVAVDDGGVGGQGALRIIDGRFQAPSFEAGPDPSMLNLAPDGGVIMGPAADWPFTAIVPYCAASAAAPVPLVVVGHGLFSDAHSELMGDRDLLEKLCMVGIGTNWTGDALPDLGVFAGTVLVNANQFGLITDRLMQAHANFVVLTRLAKNALASDPAFALGSRPAYDPSTVYYWGASNGGIQGATYLALSPDVERGVLNVPGAEWSLMIWRSADFGAAIVILDASYPDKLDQQLLIGLSQLAWDRTDPIEFAVHFNDPLPGVPMKKNALFQESSGDAAVTNLATEVEMRTLGATGLAPLVHPVFGIPSAPGPLSGIVYTQWDVQPTPLPPATDVPPPGNSAHGACRALPESIAQTKAFLTPGGEVIQTCDGGCLFPP